MGCSPKKRNSGNVTDSKCALAFIEGSVVSIRDKNKNNSRAKDGHEGSLIRMGVIHPFCKDLKSFVCSRSYPDLLKELLHHTGNWKGEGKKSTMAEHEVQNLEYPATVGLQIYTYIFPVASRSLAPYCPFH